MIKVLQGIDIVECAVLKERLDRYGERFLVRVFTKAEREYCSSKKNSLQHFAGRLASKEAVLKMLGTGWTMGATWTDIEVLNNSSGCPSVKLSGRCGQLAEQL